MRQRIHTRARLALFSLNSSCLIERLGLVATLPVALALAFAVDRVVRAGTKAPAVVDVESDFALDLWGRVEMEP